MPILKSNDSIKYKIKNTLYNINKENSFLTQTPQAFRYKDLYKLASVNTKNKTTDEASLFIENQL